MKWIIFITLAFFLAAGCSSDPDTPLGAEFLDDGTLGSRPGEVVIDTITIGSGASSFDIGARLDKNQTLSLGMESGYQSSLVLKIDFSNAGSDTEATVEKARLRLRATDASQGDTLIARFFELLTPYQEGDTLQSLDIDPSPIPDSSLTNVDRLMPTALGLYTLPPDLVRDWIRGDKTHNGIAVVLEGIVSGDLVTFGSREYSSTDFRPLLEVTFSEGYSSRYSLSDDGTFVETISSTSNLVISDGFIRRALIPVDLSDINSDVMIHDARLVLNVVPSTSLGSNFGVYLYSPDSDDPSNPEIRSGQGVTVQYINFVSNELILPVRNVLMLYLSGSRANTGFVLQFYEEGKEIRQVEFYSSVSDSLGPRMLLTASSSSEFDE